MRGLLKSEQLTILHVKPESNLPRVLREALAVSQMTGICEIRSGHQTIYHVNSESYLP